MCVEINKVVCKPETMSARPYKFTFALEMQPHKNCYWPALLVSKHVRERRGASACVCMCVNVHQKEALHQGQAERTKESDRVQPRQHND